MKGSLQIALQTRCLLEWDVHSCKMENDIEQEHVAELTPLLTPCSISLCHCLLVPAILCQTLIVKLTSKA